PFIAWYLGISLWQAFVMDVSFALFYMVYAFGFNWAYDRLFPLPEWKTAQASD
ncbi:chlorhexidine efflux transporter, partial [Marinovum algicola]